MSPKLYLYPQNIDYIPASIDAFTVFCQEIGLLGELINTFNIPAQKNYFVGSQFLSLITFMGCSPYLKIAPDSAGDTNFTFVSIKTSSEIKFYYNSSSRSPRCPACNEIWSDWQKILPAWLAEATTDKTICPACGADIEVSRLDWKRTAGFVRFGLAISNIFPKEAIPSNSLLDFLEKQSACTWKYFYC